MTMDVREKLVELFRNAFAAYGDGITGCTREEFFADFIAGDGVTVQQLDGCFRCKDSQKMTVTISNNLIGDVNIGWLGGNLTAIYCPFCGRRLPKPPKGEWL